MSLVERRTHSMRWRRARRSLHEPMVLMLSVVVSLLLISSIARVLADKMIN